MGLPNPSDGFAKRPLVFRSLLEFYEPVYLELIAALCNSAIHYNIRVDAIHACMLFNSNTRLRFFNVTTLTQFACMVFYYRYISLRSCSWVSLIVIVMYASVYCAARGSRPKATGEHSGSVLPNLGVQRKR